MKRATYILALAILIPGILIRPLVHAAESAAPASPRLTLSELINEAATRNAEIRFYEAEILAAKAGRKTAGTIASPEWNGSAGRKTASGPGLSSEGIAWSMSVMQPIEWPGRMGLRKAIADRDVELAELGLGRFKLALQNRVRQLALSLGSAGQLLSATEEVSQRFKELREVLVAREPAGIAPLLEVRVMEATELSLQHKAADRMLALKSAMLELNQVRGAALDAVVTPELEILELRTADPLDSCMKAAQINHFELRVRAAELAQQGFRVALARKERFPSISAGPTFSEETLGNERERIIGVGLSLPLPLWTRNQPKVEAAEARRIQAEASMQTAERDLQKQVAEAWHAYETRRKTLESWRPDAIEHFQEAARTADRHYRLGAVPASTYVELQKQYLEAVEGLLEARKQALEAACTLSQLTGLPLLAASKPSTPAARHD